ncbi:MAG: serine hydrolase [Oscillospiraceae bacterium]
MFDFTAAERSTLDALLDAWAEKPTVGPTVQNEEGEDIVLPVPESGLGSGHNVALYFMDLDSGASYSYNAEARFSAASLPKAPFAAYLYQQAALGACDLDEYITVTPAHVAGSEEHTGVLKTYELPAAFSVEALIGLMIRESDTVALRVLMAHYGTEGFTAWAEALGASAEDIADVLNARICANDGGIFALELYKTMQENPYGALLREHMENTRQTMITSNYPVARKYGWDRAAYHDMAVVYAPHPYLLVILTDKWGGTGWETATFGLIASEVENMVAQKWAGLEGAASLSLLPAG